MNILLAGGIGFVGSALARHLQGTGHRVSLLSRRPAAPAGPMPVFHWDPEREELERGALDGVAAVVNLSGESLAGGRWTRARKQRLVQSRAGSTRFLVKEMREGTPPPRVLLNASAVGYYGSRGEEVLTGNRNKQVPEIIRPLSPLVLTEPQARAIFLAGVVVEPAIVVLLGLIVVGLWRRRG